MKLIFICSPYAGDIEVNTIKAKEYCRWAYLYKDVNVFAPHLFYTQFLEESVPRERRYGISLGMDMLEKCDEMWVFGTEISKGMGQEIERARQLKIPIVFRGEEYWKEPT